MEALKLLLIEDDPGNIKLVEEAVAANSADHEIIVANYGEEALDFLENDIQKKGRPDVILLDLKLPRMTGIEFLDEIKKNDKFSDIPVIVLTNTDDPEVMKEVNKYRSTSYIIKPSGYTEYLELINFIVEYWKKNSQIPHGRDFKMN
ncbi:MAG: response regulator [Bacteroidia bacterium]